MEKIISHSDFLQKTAEKDKAFLLLYKEDSEQSMCAYKNFKNAISDITEIPVFAADVASVRDIHTVYGITSVPSLLIFENNSLISVVKGCNESNYYKALTQNVVFRAKAKAEGKVLKRVTVYSTPNCSWCNTLKSWLRKNSIPFSEIDVSQNEKAAQDLVRRSGHQGVPQTDINGQIVVGFNQQKLEELLEIA